MSSAKNIEEALNIFSNTLMEKLDNHFADMSKPVIKNIKEIIIALVLFLRSARGWYGRMTIMGIARCMQTEGSVKTKCKRLDRFLINESFQLDKAAAGLFTMIEHQVNEEIIPVLIDQTDLSGVQVIAASTPYQGRALPFALTTFEFENIKYSQNEIEKEFFILLQRTVGREKSLDSSFPDLRRSF
jgi:hypothetical protein